MRKRSHLLLSLLATFVLVALVTRAVRQEANDSHRSEVRELVDRIKDRLAYELHERLHLLRGLSAFAKQDSGFTEDEFVAFATALRGEQGGIRSLQLAPAGVVTYLTNPEQNKAAIGHDLLADPVRREFAREAIKARNYLVEGPTSLIQGGRALIGRLPVFVDRDGPGPRPYGTQPTEHFWGFATILIDVDHLLASAGVTATESGAVMALRGRDGIETDLSVFYGEPASFDDPDFLVDVALPSGSWQLAVIAPPELASFSANLLLLWVLGVALALVGGWLFYACLRRPAILSEAVDEATRALGETEDKLRHSQRLEALGQLTGGMAHDFNNILAVVMGSLELLELQVEDGAKARESIDMASEAAKKGAGLTRSLLAFSRRQALEPKTCYLNELIASMTSMLSRTLGETTEIRTDLQAGIGQVCIDAPQFEAALLNLAVNARHAIPKSGRLSIETREVLRPSEDGTGAMVPYVQCTVADDGVGMSADTLERVFEPFFTTRPGSGSGLGLSMVYGFVTQSSGAIEITSEPGQGTTVCIFLPVVSDACFSAAEPKNLTKPSPALGLSILVAEDNAAVRNVVVGQLETLGYRVTEAEDVPTAMAIYEEHGPFDALLSDVVLPGGESGYDLAASVQALHPSIGLIFMSGYEAEAYRQPGIHGPLLNKPFTMRELHLALNSVLGDVAVQHSSR